MSSAPHNRAFNMRCQSKYGGFSKYPDHLPDILHAHYGLAGLSLMGAEHLKPLDVAIALTKEVGGTPAPPLR
jgi:geranylgeranyl transferase type-1 subunit beta